MMEKISIEGGKPLFGKVEISGSKNSSLSILASCLLTDKKISIFGVPKLTDTFFFLKLLSSFGVDIEGLNNFKNTEKFILNAKKITNNKAPYNLVKKMRASILVLGPLLARTGRAIVSLPGGCSIGLRPVDIHLKSLEKLGAKIFIEKGYIYAEALKGLKGNKIIWISKNKIKYKNTYKISVEISFDPLSFHRYQKLYKAFILYNIKKYTIQVPRIRKRQRL